MFANIATQRQTKTLIFHDLGKNTPSGLAYLTGMV
jgi:hypothetical protein